LRIPGRHEGVLWVKDGTTSENSTSRHLGE
jgi:hypothetical protein